MRLLTEAVKASKRSSSVMFPLTFVTTHDLPAEKQPPSTPLARLIQGGRGGAVRLKLYLLLTMAATSHPYDIRNPKTPHTYARTLGVRPDPAGVRRISDNLRWLAEHRFIELTKRPGAPSAIQLLNPLGTGKKLQDPRPDGRYLTMPLNFWSNGWLIDLSPTAIAVLFALRERLGKSPTPLYLVRDRRESYTLSHDTWTRGTAELKDHGLLEVSRVPQGSDYDYHRLRNTYWLDLDRMRGLSTDEPGATGMINFTSAGAEDDLRRVGVRGG